jgi:hypothetical protein
MQARSPRAFGSRRYTGRNVLELPTGVVFTDVVMVAVIVKKLPIKELELIDRLS